MQPVNPSDIFPPYKKIHNKIEQGKISQGLQIQALNGGQDKHADYIPQVAHRLYFNITTDR